MSKTTVSAEPEDTRLILPRLAELLREAISQPVLANEVYLTAVVLLEEYDAKYGKKSKRDSN